MMSRKPGARRLPVEGRRQMLWLFRFSLWSEREEVLKISIRQVVTEDVIIAMDASTRRADLTGQGQVYGISAV